MKFLIKCLFLFVTISSCSDFRENYKKLNVLFIIVDDLNDYVEGYNGHPQSSTPNIAKFSSSAVTFLNAHSPSPMCGASRSSFLTGIYPHNSNNFFQDPWFNNQVLNNSRTIMEQFQKYGYYTWGTGKVMHHLNENIWTEYGNPADYGPSVYNGKEKIAHPYVNEPFRSIGWVDGSFGPLIRLDQGINLNDSLQWILGNTNHGVIPIKFVDEKNRDLTPDENNANLAVQKINELAKKDVPFFAAVGFLRPHTPLIVPKNFFDRFPLDQIQLPEILDSDDLDTFLRSMADGGLNSNKLGKKMFNSIVQAYDGKELGLKKFIQAYLACIAAVDENVGDVLKALEKNNLDKNTIVVLTSDHGFHMGEKDYLYKNSLWEESTRVPLIIRAPGISTPGKVDRAVSLIDIYPTLLDLTQLPKNTLKNNLGHSLDGHSMKGLLENPKIGDWSGPEVALSLIHSGPDYADDPTMQHYTIRTNRYRYILYNTGQEELYDHHSDPNEWYNLALKVSEKDYVLKEMRAKLKKITHPYKLKGLSYTN